MGSDFKISIHQIGFELGYQFVFWKRFSVDLILLGPGVASYNVNASVAGNLTSDQRQEFLDKLNQAIKDKFPGYEGLDLDGKFNTQGTANTTSLGYRYLINVGYRF